MTDIGIAHALGQAIPAPFPQSWLGRADAPAHAPSWVTIGPLTSRQVYLLECQIGYDQSLWDYKKVGEDNKLGRYQIDPVILEQYGLLSTGSNAAYGTACVNYLSCWHPTYIKTATNAYSRYFYNTDSLYSFLQTTIAQDHLAYQILYDCYNSLVKINAITAADSADTVAGMMYVAWTLGVGSPANAVETTGTGAWAWRYMGLGEGTDSFNSGRYAAAVLS